MFMVLAFTSTAHAQLPLGVISCSATPVTPLVRAEGVAEATGDIDILCTNTPGAVTEPELYSTTNLTVLSTNTNVTNSIGLVTGGGPNTTEAVVIINANHGLPSTTSDLGGGGAPDGRFPGPQYMGLIGNTQLEALGLLFPVPGSPNDGGVAPGTLDDCDDFTSDTNEDSCFPPITTIKIGNIRVNVSGLASPAQVTATVSMTGPNTIPIFPNVLNIALPLTGLTWEAVADSTAGLLCEPSDGETVAITLTEGFATSFKTIGVPTLIPGNTQWESGYDTPGSGVLGGGATQATRFKIWFLNVPDGVSVSVPTGMNSAIGESDDCNDIANWDSDGLCLQLVSGADEWGAGGTSVAFGGGTASVAIDDDGMGMVVYEVKDAHPFVTESITLDALFTWSGSAADPGTAQVVVNFAPIATGLEGEYSFVADGFSPRPRFIDTGSNPADAFSLRRCTTTLLFPWITNQASFDTGVVISNTSEDWLLTPNQSGICTIHWHGTDAGGATFSDTPSGIIDAGDQFIFLVSAEASGFQGYIIVVCEFQFAHGFAFLTDGFGSFPTLAQGYLGLVLEEADSPSGLRIGPEASDQ